MKTKTIIIVGAVGAVLWYVVYGSNRFWVAKQAPIDLTHGMKQWDTQP